MRQKYGCRPNVDAQNPHLRIIAGLFKNHLHLFLDLAGRPLGRRGYRTQQGAAPLQEGLAAALLFWADYSPEEAFCDPMCGSGTLAIEAALFALGRAPGLLKTMGVERWPHWGPTARPLLEELKKEARAREKPSCPPITARDIDETLLEKARQNAKTAGVYRHIRFELGDATAARPPGPHGLVGTNPPYGLRLENEGGQKGMKAFYFKWGEAMQQWSGWRLAILSANKAFESAFHRRPSKRMQLKNGPLDCQLLHYTAKAKPVGLRKIPKVDKNRR
jgi:putative N6-adenine-specific DNA methylase